ncbi:MAG: Gfo/Idh/MocA family protein [Janthinobacterium lividum]
MTDKRTGVGIVGLTPGRSWAATAHVPALGALPGYALVGVANSSLDSAQRAAEACGIPHAFADAAALARDPAVDLVTVAVKVPHHRTLVDAALDAGKMVYCEWPLGRTLEEAEDMAARARAVGVRTAVGLQARSSPVIRYVRDLVRDGYVGEVLSTTLVGSAMIQAASAPERQTYLYDRVNGATAFTIPFGHALDALCWVLGDFREVEAMLETRRRTFTVQETGKQRPMNADDQIVVGGVLESGAVVCAHYRGGLSRGTNLLWEINGTAGDLRITADNGHMQMFELSLWGGRGAEAGLSRMDVPQRYRTGPAELTGFAINVGEAYARFGEGPDAADPVPDFDDAVKLHRLLDTIARAAATGQRSRV